MVKECCKTFFLVISRPLAHTIETEQRSAPTLCPGCGALYGVPPGHALPSTGYAEGDISSCSPASTVLCCVRLPKGILNRTYGFWPSPAHPFIRGLFRVRRLHRYTPISMHQGVFASWITPFQLFDDGSLPALPILAQKAYAHARFFDSAGSHSNSHLTLLVVWPSLPVHEVGTRKLVFSELDSPPAFSPVNASATALPQPPHDSGLT